MLIIHNRNAINPLWQFILLVNVVGRQKKKKYEQKQFSLVDHGEKTSLVCVAVDLYELIALSRRFSLRFMGHHR